MLSAFIAFLHHAAAFTLVGALVAQHLLFTPQPDCCGVAFRVPDGRVLVMAQRYSRRQAPRMPEAQARRIMLLMRAQLAFIAAILFCAAFMAKGLS
jgi:uncharacterized membrane protein